MRIAVFIDFWNFQLTLNRKVSALRKVDTRVNIDWKNIGLTFASEAHSLLKSPAALSYEGCYVYTSFNPARAEGTKFKNWVTTWLDRQPGVNVQIRERRRKNPPVCPSCHQPIEMCPHNGCGQRIVATEEKGIDTLLVTDLLRLGHTDSYDAAVVVTLDADMVPAIEYIQSRGKKVIQAGFPPQGMTLATKCWASFDVLKILPKIERT